MKLLDKILILELRPYLWPLLGILLLVFASVGFQALSPLSFKILIDNVLGSERLSPTTLTGALFSFFSSREVLGLFTVLIYCLSIIFSNVTEYYAGTKTKRLSRNIVWSFAKKAFENMEKLDIAYYKRQSLGDYLYRLSYDVSALGNLLEDGVLPLVTNFLYIVTTLGILFFLNVNLAFIALLILPILGLGLHVFNKSIDRATGKSEQSNSLLFSFIQQILNQLKIVQVFNQETKELVVFDEKERQALEDEYILYGLGFLLNAAIGIIIALGYSLVLVYGFRSVILGELSTGALIVFIFYLDNLTYPLINLITATTALREQYIKVSRMDEFFTPKLYTHNTGTLTEVPEAEIVFNNVVLYGDDQVPILQHASFTIPKGKKTALIGVSGSGKTTVASLILRLLEPLSGKILVSGKNINEYDVEHLRDTIAYVPQEVVLFNDTIRNNIAFGNPEASFSDIKEAARLAVADSFIESIPSGYQFHVGEEGGNLSGGQRQRILLARAFLRKEAKIIILDEPLSFLDVRTRAELIKNLNIFAKNKTVIIISNILEVLDQADQIIILNEEAVVHAGKADSLRYVDKLSKLILRS